LERFNISEWASQVPEQKAFRQAVHTILTAISGSSSLQATMIMKGGILLALAYESSRYTKDIDFSTGKTLDEFDAEEFIQEFEGALMRSVEELDYGLSCLIQSWKQQPPQADATFPTIRINIGYANKSEASAHKRLLRKNSSHIVQVDYSLNEPLGEPELFEIEEGKVIQTYNFHDLIGEKFRAVLQQEVRNRIRRQDIFDLHLLLKDQPFAKNHDTKEKILASLKEKARARYLEVSKESMSNPRIIHRSKIDYHSLASEIDGELPPFDEIYASVKFYYENLPWDG
jgi:hypothetical protein